MLEKGTTVFGNWTVEEKIGSGAFGTVYKIKREEFGKVYYSALKVLQIPQDKDEYRRLKSEGMDDASISTYYSQVVQDFVSEIELLSSLDGITNIVDYKDHIIEANSDMGYTIYIKMQLLTPISKSLLNSDGSVHFMDVEEVIKLGKDMCSALEVCEKRNIIHRDIKIDNIFISENGDYKLGDFGIAKQLEATQGEMSQKGTLLYMAPEVFKGEKYDKTADIYSLGMVLYRLLNKNRAPFFPNYPEPIKFSDKEAANIRRIKGEEFPNIMGISAELNAILKKACAFSPKNRYQSASEFKSALKNVNVDGILQNFDELTSNSNAIVFEETSNDEATVGVFSANSVTTIDNEFEDDKTESFINNAPVVVEIESIDDEESVVSVKKDELGEGLFECENEQHDFVAVEEYTGGTRYVCSRCGKTIHKSILFPSNECADENGNDGINENENESTIIESKESKNKNKKPLIFSLCAVAVVLSIILVVIFISDGNDDIPMYDVGYTDLPAEEQVDDYVSADDDTDFSDGEESVSNEGLIDSNEESDDIRTKESTTKKNSSKETTTKNNSTANNKRPTLPNVIGMTQQQAINILNNFIKENNLRTNSSIDVIKYYRSDVKKGTVFNCNYSAPEGPNYYDNITIDVSMGDGDKAWSSWSETINVPSGYTASGFGNPYAVYSKSGSDDIEVEESGPHERRRVIYKDKNDNVVKTEAWSEWTETNTWYPFDKGEEYIGYDETTGYTKYYETQKNKVFYRWRYCETYH